MQNAIDLAHALGLPEVRVAILSAMETVNPKVPSTIEAAALCKMADRGQITGGAARRAARARQRDQPRARRRSRRSTRRWPGGPTCCVVPDLEAGNMLAKSLSFLAGADAAGIVLGARVPVILTSRADSADDAARLLRGRGARRQGARARPRSDRWWRDHERRASLVLNAGSSSIKFALFGGRRRSTCVVRGQVEGSHTAPRFVAKDAAGAHGRRADLGRGHGQLGHDGALEHLVDFLREQLGGHAARRRRPSRRARRRSHYAAAGARRRRGARRSSTRSCPLAPAAPAAQPGADPGRRASGARSCRRWPASTPRSIAAQPEVAQAFALPQELTDARRAALRLPRPVVRVHRQRAAAARRPARRAGRAWSLHLGNGASMCAHVGRPQRRQHDGLHRRRRPADGHALRQPRPRRRCST